MKNVMLFKEYIWLVETLLHGGKMTFAELGEKWLKSEMSGGVSYSRSTFNRHRDAVLDMFGVIIECDRRDDYRYYIENAEVLRESTVQNWMFSTMSVSKLLNENVALHERILLESVPSGDELLQHLIRAMRESRRVMITYRRYGAASANSFVAEPYCLKLFRRRWYVLLSVPRPSHSDGNKIENSFMVFSLDRIEHCELQESKFTIDPDFDAAAFFSECFGVVVGDGSKPERIMLRAYGREQYYLRDLPLHHSQQIIATANGYTDFEVTLRPTPDFMSHIMSRGEWLEVISPQWIAEEIRDLHQDAINGHDSENFNLF